MQFNDSASAMAYELKHLPKEKKLKNNTTGIK